MTYEVAARNVVRAVSLGAVSYLALSLDFASGSKAFAQSNLPPVTVDAPGQQRARPAAPRSQTSTSRVQRRVAAPAPRRAEPVPYVTPSTGTLGSPPAPYAGGQVASGGSLGLLGNRGVMDTPFNQTSYTAELIAESAGADDPRRSGERSLGPRHSAGRRWRRQSVHPRFLL